MQFWFPSTDSFNTFFQIQVDHQSYSNSDVFSQRYIISTQYWKPNGPIWFYAGNEGDIFSFANNTGFMWENAPKFNAMVIFMEHRYYGQTMPYGNNSFSVSPRFIAETVQHSASILYLVNRVWPIWATSLWSRLSLITPSF